MGSSRAALAAGQIPKPRPTASDVKKAIKTQAGWMTAGKGENGTSEEQCETEDR